MERASGVVLAGGRSRRMGADKRFLPAGGTPLIERALGILRSRCAEVLVSANDPESFGRLGVPVVPDLLEGAGPLAGIHAGLLGARNDLVLFLPVDTPFVAPVLLERLREETGRGFDLVCGSTPWGVEPLVGYYRKACIGPIEACAARGRFKVTDFFPSVRARVLGPEETAAADPSGRSYANLNTPADFEALAPCGAAPGERRGR